MGSLNGTAEGEKLLSEMEKHSMLEVRNLVDNLMAKEYDLREPVRQSEQQNLQNFEASLQIIVRFHQTREKVSEGSHSVQLVITNVLEMLRGVRETFIPILSKVPMKGSKDGTEFIVEFDALFRTLNEAQERLEHGHVMVKGEEIENQMHAIDSDEEARLFEELDQLMDAQERAQAFRGNAHKFMANAVQKAFRHISEMENAFRLVRNWFKTN
jgi:hypothetical protein